MARQAHPWFRRSDGWWYVKINGKQQKLARGPQEQAGGSRSLARTHAGAGQPIRRPTVSEHTVASVIDLYLTHSKRLYAPQSYANRHHYLQLFAEAHGFRLIRDACPCTSPCGWTPHTEWISDWTRSNVVRIVQRAFNWAVQQGIIKANPFRGVTQRLGKPDGR